MINLLGDAVHGALKRRDDTIIEQADTIAELREKYSAMEVGVQRFLDNALKWKYPVEDSDVEALAEACKYKAIYDISWANT